MSSTDQTIHIVGAGLAGSECAYQLALKGFSVCLYEMRGQTMTPAHKTSGFAELVCSNSFGSQTDYSAPGQLKWEAEAMGSLILKAAREAAVPAGMSLSVDREVFSNLITEKLKSMPNVTIVNRAVESLDDIPRPAVIATGPLTHDPLAESMRRHFDDEFLYFFDAIAPVIDADTINEDIAWKGDRFGKGTADYYNCGMNKELYYRFADEILKARKVVPKEFEATPYFEGCMPIETMFERGVETPRFGPMSFKGLKNPRTGERYYAVVQLRQDNKEGTAFNMVGFQTKMAYGEQTRIFRMIPGLEEAEFLKLGSMHRNLYIRSPRKLTPVLSSPKDPLLFFAGQITGVEGYFESTCVGLMVANFLTDRLKGREISPPPRASAFGALLNAITEDNETFQPTNINFGLFPRPEEHGDLHGRKNRQEKKALQLRRAKETFQEWAESKTGVKPILPALGAEVVVTADRP
jgi:methylenetetrahydrofolate--tRNA-(uracil-5-)-methyltransferase